MIYNYKPFVCIDNKYMTLYIVYLLPSSGAVTHLQDRKVSWQQLPLQSFNLDTAYYIFQ